MIQVKAWVNVQSEIKGMQILLKAAKLKQNLRRGVFTHQGRAIYKNDSYLLVFEQKPVHYSPSMC